MYNSPFMSSPTARRNIGKQKCYTIYKLTMQPLSSLNLVYKLKVHLKSRFLLCMRDYLALFANKRQ